MIYLNKQVFSLLIIILRKLSLRVMSQDQVGIQLRRTNVLNCPGMMGSWDLGSSMLKLEKSQGNQNQLVILNPAKFIFHFFFCNYIPCQTQQSWRGTWDSVVQNNNTDEGSTLIILVLQMRGNKVQRCEVTCLKAFNINTEIWCPWPLAILLKQNITHILWT